MTCGLESRNQEKGVLAKGISAESRPVALQGNKKNRGALAPAVTFETLTALMRQEGRSVSAENPLLKTLH